MKSFSELPTLKQKQVRQKGQTLASTRRIERKLSRIITSPGESIWAAKKNKSIQYFYHAFHERQNSLPEIVINFHYIPEYNCDINKEIAL